MKILPCTGGKVATAKGYKRPDKLPTGFEIEDKMSKRTWKVGEMIGQGGFADVYSGNSTLSALRLQPFQYP